MIDADDILDEADEQTERWRTHARDAAALFHDDEGELRTREEAVEFVVDGLDVSSRVAQEVLANLVADTVDPVVQVPVDGERYIGVIEYEEFDGAYGYVDFNDQFGKRKRVVCGACVHAAELDSQVTHATAGDPNGSFDEDATYDDLLDAIHDHYDEAHDTKPEEVETGASLASPTTIGGNTAWHQGNDGDLYLNTGNDTLLLEVRQSDPASPQVGQMWLVE